MVCTLSLDGCPTCSSYDGVGCVHHKLRVGPEELGDYHIFVEAHCVGLGGQRESRASVIQSDLLIISSIF